MTVIEIRKTQSFADWFSDLRDKHAKARIQARIDRMSLGNLGDTAPVGEGCQSCAFTTARATGCISFSAAMN